jgi:glycerol-1-phosphatase
MEVVIPDLYGADAIAIPGSRALLAAVAASRAPWAIVTSGTRPLVEGWLRVMALAHPAVLVTAEDVERGKPDPRCYLLGRQRLGLAGEGEGEGGSGRAPGSMLVVEDAPAGVRAGKAAGFRVLGLATTHAVEQVREAGADWVVKDLRSLRFVGYDAEKGEVKVEILDALLT